MDHDPSFVALFVKNQRRIYGYILTVVPDCNEADDLFQQTSLVLWEKAGEFRPEGDFVRWACGIAFNVIRNYRVKKRRDRHCFSDEMMAQLGRGAGGEIGVARSRAGRLAHVHAGPRPLRPPAAGALLRGDAVDPRGIRGSGSDGELRLPAFAPYPRAVAGVHRAKDSREDGAMTQAELQDDPLREYAQQYCSGTLSAEQTAALEQRLRDDPRAMEFFVLYMEIHSQIAWEARARERTDERGERGEEREKGWARRARRSGSDEDSGFRVQDSDSADCRHPSSLILQNLIIQSFPSLFSPLSPLPSLCRRHTVLVSDGNSDFRDRARGRLRLVHVSDPVQVARQSAPLPSPSHLSPQMVGRITGMVDCQWEKGSGIRDRGQGPAKSPIPNP